MTVDFHMDTVYRPADFGADSDEEEDLVTSAEWSFIEGPVDDFMREKADELYNDLREYYEALTSTDAICESLDANEYLFYADGSEEVWFG